MTIEKHGVWYHARFVCSVCGCAFRIEPEDVYRLIYPSRLGYTGKDIRAECPECGLTAYQEQL